ncbi:NERD domain-containing protein [Zhihengliuella salsuginis]|uniref:Nuclease n=1 Tax=Zhihengliuella salsuginis TaxID=578222 RepID=A0ABQ3GLP1_9MICC|nr:NERD domain-containing protein [Zhihengliuella salsuginis]GHD13853.1 nuclease [Zhihengliuella salsuginis]
MARSIPEDPAFTDGHEAEKYVWEQLLAALPDSATVLHSVPVRHCGAEAELDFLVLWPGVGLAALEVKGGQVGVEGGRWYQSDRKGKHPIQSPATQVQSAGHTFLDWWNAQNSHRLSSRFAHVVVLPYTRVPADWEPAGLPRCLVLDQGQVEGDPAALAGDLRRAIESEGAGHTSLAEEYAERILARVVQDLSGDATDADAALEIEHVQDSLTERQRILLSATRDLKRVRFVGGAGSGKTYLALARAQELAKSGLRVGIFCYNIGLGGYLKERVGQWKRQQPPAYVGGFHDFALSLGVPAGDGQEYYDVEMPRQLREIGESLPAEQKFDAVIVDEAQDFAPSWWEALLACLKDPAEGRIFAFMDTQQDVYQRWDGEPLGASFGRELELVKIHVDGNMRNTRRIVDTFKPLIDADVTSQAGQGLPVRFVQCASEDAVDRADDVIEALFEDGWDSRQMALLTTRHRHPVHFEHHDGGTITEYWDDFREGTGVFYGHVLGFKGLERSVVVLCINGFRDDGRAAEKLYVGLSRARSLLIVVGDRQMIEDAVGPQKAAALDAARAWTPASTA